MIPHERSLVEKLKNKPFALIGVNSDPEKSFYASENKDDMRVIWRSFWCGPKGTSGPIPSKWNVRSWPTIYVLDHKGVIRFQNVRNEKMEAAVEELLAELEKEQKEQPKEKAK
jgi:hypothetical protein